MRNTKLNLLFYALICSLSALTQSNYYFGYGEGFKYGCQCIDIPPKNVAYNKGSYSLGYLDGKVDGLIYSQNKKPSNQEKTTTYNKPHDYKRQLYTPNYALIEQTLKEKQSKYNSNKDRVLNSIQSIKKTIQLIRDDKTNFKVNSIMGELYILENSFYKDFNKILGAQLDYSKNQNTNYALSLLNKHNENLRRLISDIKVGNENTIDRLRQMLTLYNSFKIKNKVVKDGWHIVYATDRDDFCEIRRVYVLNGRVNKYVLEGEMYKVWNENLLGLSTVISNCKSTIQLKGVDQFVEIFFINVLSDWEGVGKAPSPLGKVSFWTDFSKEEILVYVENKFVGELKLHFSNNAPYCGQKGTINFTNNAGTYKYVAITGSGVRWEGEITISPDKCRSFKLRK
jgi:hypothetical protein